MLYNDAHIDLTAIFKPGLASGLLNSESSVIEVSYRRHSHCFNGHIQINPGYPVFSRAYTEKYKCKKLNSLKLSVRTTW